MGVAAGERWYAVNALPHKEVLAKANLERQGWRSFLPLVLKTRRHARKLQTVRAPLFPRYLFVALDVARDRWRSVNGTLGVVSLVMAGDMPCPVPQGIVEEWLAAVRPDGVVDPDYGFRPGDPVCLVAGPFAGGLGKLLSLDDKGRVEMLLEMLNGSVRVKVARDMLRPVG